MKEGDVAQLQTLENELKRKQEDFSRREHAYKLRVKELTQELDNLKAEHTKWMHADPKMCELKKMHQEIVQNVGRLQAHTVKLVQEQERDLLHAFRSRLFDVRRELERERAKKDDGASAWIERSRKLELDVDQERERADKLDRINHSLNQENSRLKQQFEMQEDDRRFVEKQLHAVKAENGRMRLVVESKKAELMEAEASSTSRLPALHDGDNAPPDVELSTPIQPKLFGKHSDAAYRDMIKKLNNTLHLERKHAEQVKRAHKDWLDHRTPLEVLLRKAVAVIALDVEKRTPQRTTRSGWRRTPVPQAALNPVILSQFTHADREKAIELWLSYDGVLDALYHDDRVEAKPTCKSLPNDTEQSEITHTAELRAPQATEC